MCKTEKDKERKEGEKKINKIFDVTHRVRYFVRSLSNVFGIMRLWADKKIKGLKL